METIQLRSFSEMKVLDMINFCETRREITVIDDLKEEVVTDTMILGANWFGLIMHRHFPEEPYLAEEVLELSGQNGYPTFLNDVHANKPCNLFMRRIMLKYEDPHFYDLIKQLLFVFQNLLHNYLSVLGEHGVVSARSVDVNRIYRHAKMKQIRKERRENKMTQDEAMIVFDRVLLTEKDFDTSVFALLYRTKALDRIQSYQMIIERGSVFDINNAVLPFNIDTPYCEGITNVADSLGDSKGAGFSLISNGAALQDSEWFHMKIHNLAQIVKSIQYQTDCGSTKGAVVTVISKDFKDSLMGKYRIMEDGSTELIHYGTIGKIKVGETIKIRSVAWCNVSHDGKPCSVCFGRMASAIPYNIYTKRSAVPGIFYGSTFGERIGQNILKTKHRIGSAMTIPFIPRKEDDKYIHSDGDYIFFQEKFLTKEKSPYIVLDRLTCLDFADFIAMENVEDLDPNHLRTYDEIQINVRVPNPMFEGRFGLESHVIETVVGSRKARMTQEFIAFLKDKKFEEEGRIMKVSLVGWDSEQPAYELPFINEDLDAYRRRVEDSLKFINLKGLIDVNVDEVSHGEQLIQFWKVVNEQSKDSNIIIHDIFLWACMCRDPKNLDYSTPTADEDRVFVSFHDCIMNRGQGNSLMYGWQSKSLTGSPANFMVKRTQGGVLEGFMNPIAE